MNDIEKIRQGHEAAVNRLLSQNDYTSATTLLYNHIEDDPKHVPYYVLLGSALKASGKKEEVLPVLARATEKYPNIPLYRCENFRKLQQSAIERGLPSIFLNTQFKSGSVFLRDALARGLNMPWQFLSPEGVSGEAIGEWLHEFDRGGALCQHHKFYDDTQKKMYQKIPNAKLLLHIRDPRQSALSAVHHYERVLEVGPDYARRNLMSDMPVGYVDWSFEEKMDLYMGLSSHIDYSRLRATRQIFEAQVEWVDRWLEAIEIDEIPMNVILTDYQDLSKGQDEFIGIILDKLGVSRKAFDFSVVKDRPKPGTKHFRKGDPNEWRHTMSTAQLERANSLMTKRLLKRYGV